MDRFDYNFAKVYMAMRIISGTLKGKSLFAPNSQTTRPTSDRARQGVFNILEHASWGNGIIDAKVLDVFAGTGSMALEALSRGAKDAVLIENDKAAIAIIKDNLAACRFSDRAKLLTIDARKIGAPPNNMAPRDLVFIDPPYSSDLAEAAIAALIANKWLADNAIVILEQHKSAEAPNIDGFEILKTTNYGLNGFWFLRAV